MSLFQLDFSNVIIRCCALQKWFKVGAYDRLHISCFISVSLILNWKYLGHTKSTANEQDVQIWVGENVTLQKCWRSQEEFHSSILPNYNTSLRHSLENPNQSRFGREHNKRIGLRNTGIELNLGVFLCSFWGASSLQIEELWPRKHMALKVNKLYWSCPITGILLSS